MNTAIIIAWVFAGASAVFAVWAFRTILSARKLHKRGLAFHAEVQDARATRFGWTGIGLAVVALLFGLVA